MLSQSPPVMVHFQLLLVPLVQALPSMGISLSGSGKGLVTMGAVGQPTSTLQEQSWVLLLASLPSQSKSPGAQTSSPKGSWAPRHSPSHRGGTSSVSVFTQLTVPTEFSVHQPTGFLVAGSIWVPGTSAQGLVVP